ncbi:MAG: nucleotidyltransferase protein [Proteobacteria bacterium]|nr:nucleotidyltransferase protein [Pseudomonadota bacterium]
MDLRPFPPYIAAIAMLDDPVLPRFRRALDSLYGARIERVVLFGSRARGDARVDSDCDVAVFLDDFENFGLESKRLAAIETAVLDEMRAVISALPFEAGAYRRQTGLLHELRREGIDF